jgi:hypothetical protein
MGAWHGLSFFGAESVLTSRRRTVGGITRRGVLPPGGVPPPDPGPESAMVAGGRRVVVLKGGRVGVAWHAGPLGRGAAGRTVFVSKLLQSELKIRAVGEDFFRA